MGTGLCTYVTSSLASNVKPLMAEVTVNPTHYGDPKTGCESDEQAVRVQGIQGDFCSPPCSTSGSCPKDEPSGDTATPTCALKTTTGGKYCALICSKDSDCGTGSCQKIMGTGLCTYATSSLASNAPANVTQVI